MLQAEAITAPASLNMSGWAALGESPPASAFGSQNSIPEAADGAAAADSEAPDAQAASSKRPWAESQLGSIAAWQAIAADVSQLQSLPCP